MTDEFKYEGEDKKLIIFLLIQLVKMKFLYHL